MKFALERKDLETGRTLVSSRQYDTLADAMADARKFAMRGRRTVRVVQVAEPEISLCNVCETQFDMQGNCQLCDNPLATRTVSLGANYTPEFINELLA